MIFETERLIVRRLILDDLNEFHRLESNPNVLKYAEGNVKTRHQNKEELQDLINKYDVLNNDFWIYAIENKQNHKFIGTVALVKDNLDDEIGYRFLEQYWGNGYGLEICQGLISYCKEIGLKKIIGYVVDANVASSKILKKCGFKIVDTFFNANQQQETKYILYL